MIPVHQLRGGTEYHVPVGGGHDGHLRIGEVFLDGVQRGRCPSSAGGDYRGGRLVRKGVPARHEHPVHHRQQVAGGVGKVHWGTENEAIRLPSLLNPSVDHILLKDTQTGTLAVIAADAVPHRLRTDGEGLRPDPVGLQSLGDLGQGQIRTAVGPLGASVE